MKPCRKQRDGMIRRGKEKWLVCHSSIHMKARQSMSELALPYTVYAIQEQETQVKRYVGQTCKLAERKKKHKPKLKEIEEQGFTPEFIELAYDPTDETSKRRERRYIYHYLQQCMPLMNVEAQYPRLVSRLQSLQIDFLTVPESDPIWQELRIIVSISFVERANAIADRMGYQRPYKDLSRFRRLWQGFENLPE
jgi:hypothetical protein